MNQSNINSRVIAILCATGLAIGLATPAITVTPPAKPTPKTPIPAKVIAPIKTTAPNPINPPIAAPSTPKVFTGIPLVAVPTLTPGTVKTFTSLYGQALAVKFTPNQQQKIQQRLNQEWMTNLSLRNTVMQTIAMEPQILSGTPDERNRLQTKLVGNLRQQVLDGDAEALWLVSFYDASPKNWLAPGQPPIDPDDQRYQCRCPLFYGQ